MTCTTPLPSSSTTATLIPPTSSSPRSGDAAPHPFSPPPLSSSSVPPPPPPSIRSLLLRLVRFLSPSERRRLLAAAAGLVVSSATNLAFPTIMGTAIDKAILGGAGAVSPLAPQLVVPSCPLPSSGGEEFGPGGGLPSDNDFFTRRPDSLVEGQEGATEGGSLFPVPPMGAPMGGVAHWLGNMLGLFGVGACAGWLRVFNLSMVTHSLERRLRKAVFEAMMKQELSYVENVRSGEQMTQLLQDVEVASKALTQNLASALRSLNSAIGGTVLMLFLSRKLTLVSLSVVPLVGAGLMLYGKYAKKLAAAVRQHIYGQMGLAEEKLNQLRTVRLFAQEASEIERVNQSLDDMDAELRQMSCAEGVQMGAMGLALNASLLGVLYFGGSLVNRGELSVGNLTSFCLYSSMVGLGFSGLSQVYGDLIRSSASIERVFSILDRPQLALSEGRILAEVKGYIELENVGFSYDNRPDVRVLDNFSMSLKPGQLVALAGVTGVGKSTICSLLTRLHELKPDRGDSGSIRLDGVDLRELNPTWLRQHVFGVVDQEPVLFAGTIRDNLRYGNSAATDDEVEHAAEQANADGFIRSLPNGYDTIVGEHGKSQLSTGQKQRIAIGRAVLKNPPCLILDEATSALDADAERQVQLAIERLIRNRTVLVIAHRPSTLQAADNIVLVEGGKCGGQGQYKQLMVASDHFKQIMTATAPPLPST
eukprot:GHVS01057895.1.p1 GENE.GHVS01057895.1~~GHVS01057895.1.p1  ORF type:complete len:705 (-),score=103.49 GHVS01057895.1:323-2437(-)